MDCCLFDVNGNLKKAEMLIREAAAKGASIVSLPEAFNTGYLNSSMKDLIGCAEGLGGRTVSRIRALAEELRIFVVAPILLKTANCVENSAIMIDDSGGLVGTYSKTHLIGEERRYLKRGSSYPVYGTKLGRIGISICYDICFPETTRILALKGADIVFAPSAWRATSYFKEWWDLNLACRALDNLVYVGAANRCGSSGEELFAGKSKLCGPVGEVVAACGVCGEGVVMGEVDMLRLRHERELNTVMLDRHPEDYLPVVEKRHAKKERLK